VRGKSSLARVEMQVVERARRLRLYTDRQILAARDLRFLVFRGQLTVALLVRCALYRYGRGAVGVEDAFSSGAVASHDILALDFP